MTKLQHSNTQRQNSVNVKCVDRIILANEHKACKNTWSLRSRFVYNWTHNYKVYHAPAWYDMNSRKVLCCSFRLQGFLLLPIRFLHFLHLSLSSGQSCTEDGSPS